VRRCEVLPVSAETLVIGSFVARSWRRGVASAVERARPIAADASATLPAPDRELEQAHSGDKHGYLSALARNACPVVTHPERWLPWNFRDA